MRQKILSMCLCLLLFVSVCVAHEEIGLTVGEMAPDFKALTHSGNSFVLSNALASGPAVLIFYRGGWCYYCNLQLQAIEQNIQSFKAMGVNVVAISVDTPNNAKKSVEDKELSFTVVSNPQADVLEKYNVVFHVPEDLAQMYKEKYQIDLKAASGRDDYLIAVPGTYIVDQNRRIVYAQVDKDYKVRPPVTEILDVLKNLESSQ